MLCHFSACLSSTSINLALFLLRFLSLVSQACEMDWVKKRVFVLMVLDNHFFLHSVTPVGTIPLSL